MFCITGVYFYFAFIIHYNSNFKFIIIISVSYHPWISVSAVSTNKESAADNDALVFIFFLDCLTSIFNCFYRLPK